MAEILVKAVDAIISDPERDREASYKRGYPVVVMPDGWTWGGKEGPPNFVRIIVPDMSVTVGEGSPEQPYVRSWQDNFDYEIVTQSAAVGRYTVRTWEANASASGLNGISLAKVGNFLDSWGCQNIAANPNSLQFDFLLNQAIRSPGFWDVPNVQDRVNFNVVTYDSGTGIGRIQAIVQDTATIKAPAVHDRILLRGGTIITEDYPSYEFDITRLRVLQEFWKDIKARVQKVYCRRQYYIPESILALAEGNGGQYTITLAQLQAEIKDKLAE